MGHASIENRTPFAFEALYLADEELRPLLVPVIRATYDIVGGHLALAEVQAPVSMLGELHGDSGETSSWKHEPEFAFFKPATDVVLIGHAFAPHAGATEMLVSLQVGSLSKTVRVTGDRVWVRSAGAMVMSPPLPFEKIPLCYERAFGGWDHTAGEPERPQFEPRNPVGMGFRGKGGRFEDGVRLPNLEDPAHRIQSYGQMPPPAGFGFTSPNWQPRAAFAGTYGEAWARERKPLLARDFDRRFFNAGSAGLVAAGYLRGDEELVVVGVSPRGDLSFRLPRVARPVCNVRLAQGPDVMVETRLDTVVVDADAEKVFVTWRGHVPLRNGPHDVRAIAIESAV